MSCCGNIVSGFHFYVLDLSLVALEEGLRSTSLTKSLGKPKCSMARGGRHYWVSWISAIMVKADATTNGSAGIRVVFRERGLRARGFGGGCEGDGEMFRIFLYC